MCCQVCLMESACRKNPLVTEYAEILPSSALGALWLSSRCLGGERIVGRLVCPQARWFRVAISSAGGHSRFWSLSYSTPEIARLYPNSFKCP